MTLLGEADLASVKAADAVELTISSAAVTVTQSYHDVDTEGDAGTDDLETISGCSAGQILFLQAVNSARTVVVKDGVGNIQASGDCTLDNAQDVFMGLCDGTNVYQIACSDNGA